MNIKTNDYHNAQRFVMDGCAWLRDCISSTPMFTLADSIVEIRHSFDIALRQLSESPSHKQIMLTISEKVGIAIEKVQEGTLTYECVDTIERLLPDYFCSQPLPCQSHSTPTLEELATV